MPFNVGDTLYCTPPDCPAFVGEVVLAQEHTVLVTLPEHMGGSETWWVATTLCTLCTLATPSRNLLAVMDLAGPAGGATDDMDPATMEVEIVPGAAVYHAIREQHVAQNGRKLRFYTWKDRRQYAARALRVKLADTRRWRYDNLVTSPQILCRQIANARRSGKAFAKALSPVLKAEREVKAHRRPSLSDDELFAALGYLHLYFLHSNGLSAAWDNYAKMCARLYGGTDTPVVQTPWRRYVWFEHIGPRLPHVSVVDGGQVAYYQTFAKLVAGVTTRIRPGRFLQKFLGDKLSEDDIRKAAEEFSRVVDSENSKNTVRWIEDDDPDGWEWAYEHGHGFSSCMVYDREDRYLNVACHGPNHPVRIYAYPGNGLRLAYLGDPPKTPGGRVYARTIVNGDGYVRIYGDSRLAGLLQDMGISDGAGLGGVHVTKRMLDGCQYIVPYLDRGEGFVDCGDHLRIVGHDAEIPGDRSNGLAEADSGRNLVTCEHCGAEVDEDETHYSGYEETGYCTNCEDGFVVAVTYVSSTGSYRYGTVLADNTVDVCGTQFIDDDDIIRHAGYETCAECGEWERLDDMVSTSRGMVCSCTTTVELAEEDPDGYTMACEADTVEVVVLETGDLARLHEDTPIDTAVYRLVTENDYFAVVEEDVRI